MMLIITIAMAILVIWTGIMPATIISMAETGAKALVDNLGKYVEVIL